MEPTIPQAYTKSKRLCIYFCIFMQPLSFYNLYAYHFSLSYLPPVMQITMKYIRLIPDARRALAHASMVLPVV